MSLQLKKLKADFKYEPFRIGYEVPATKHSYLPDFVLSNGIVIEAKGYLDSETRKKMLCVKLSNPSLDIRFVFGRAGNAIRKGSKTTYGDWCNKHGFKFSEQEVPKEWLM